MKKIGLFFVIVLLSVCSYAQESLTFSRVIQAEGATKDAIYATLLDWISTNYKGIKSDSQVTDKDAGLIVKQGTFEYSKGGIAFSCYSGYVSYKLKFQIREGRYKAEVTSFIHDIKIGNSDGCRLGLITTAEEYGKGGMQKGANNKVWNDIKEKAENYSESIFDSLEELKYDAFSTDTKEDW